MVDGTSTSARKTTMTDAALIIGSGSVGLTIALELARYGVAVRIVDRMTARTDTSRAIGIWPRTLEPLDRQGVSRELVARGNRVTAASILSGGRHIARLDLVGLASPHPFLLMLPALWQGRYAALRAADRCSAAIRPDRLFRPADRSRDAWCRGQRPHRAGAAGWLPRAPGPRGGMGAGGILARPSHPGRMRVEPSDDCRRGHRVSDGPTGSVRRSDER